MTSFFLTVLLAMMAAGAVAAPAGRYPVQAPGIAEPAAGEAEPAVKKVVGCVKGKNTQMPVEFATIQLHDAATGRMAAGATADSTGTFAIGGVAQGRYYVVCSFVGFTPLTTKPFSVSSSPATDIGTLWMDDEGQQLGEVVVAGRKPTFVAQLDRKVYDVGSDVMSSAGSVADLMQNIPTVDVDIDGNVSLRGNDNVTVLVNGKPSAMMGAKTRGDALNQMPAGTIERIEVITNPSARFKPDGVSGIINIVLKQNANAGTGATLTANAGSHGRYNAGASLNWGLGRTSIFGGYAFRRDRYDRTTTDRRSSADSNILQETYGLGRPTSHTFRLGMDSRLTDNDELQLSGSYNRRRFRRNEQVTSQTTDMWQQVTDSYHRLRDALAYENMWEAAMHYAHTYGKDNEWGVDYTYSAESEDEMNRYSTTRNNAMSRNNEGVWNANYLHTATLHLTHHMGSVKIMAGYEMEHLRTEQDYRLYCWDGSAFVYDGGNSSSFVHWRLLNTLYATAEMPLGRWKLMAGLRGELAHVDNRLLSLNESASQHYANLLPTLHASWQIDAHNEWLTSYSMRVNRPDGEDMNPFTERINPLSLQSGNPDLKPEKAHSIETGWMWHDDYGTSLTATLYYRYLTNEITEVSRYVDNGVLLTTKANMDASQSAGMEVVWSQNVGRWLSFNLNANGYYNEINAQKLGYGRHKGAFSWSALLGANITPVKHATLQVNARYRSPRLVPQGKRDADCRINLGAKYEIPGIGLSILGSVTDLFDTYRKSYTLDTPQLKQKVERRRNPRIIYLGVSYQIGANKKHSKAKPEYDDSL